MNKISREIARWPKRWPIAGAALAITVIAFSSPVLAAKGGIKGPPTGGESPNNLSAPAAQTESVNAIAANWAVPAEPTLGVHYSYGCDVPQSDGQFSYPNKSCVDNLSNPTEYLDVAQCTAPSAPCDGLTVDRIYWQKVDVNEWWADDHGISPDPGYVAYIDWGDALEAVSWNERSVIRVETQPWSSTIPGFDPSLGTCETAALNGPDSDCKIGFQMWHVSGQGIDEHWGIRATEPDGIPFNYDSPFQIIKTTNARLNLAKMVPQDAECRQPGGGDDEGEEAVMAGEDPPSVGDWDPLTATWGGTCTWYDAPYSVETSVGGKYVYGYNWRMKNVELESMCGTGWHKTGYWRLTFYTPGTVRFDDGLAPNVAPPAVPAEPRTLPRTAFNTSMAPPAEPPDDDRLYWPIVDTTNNLTYIDICVVAKTKGGGGGGGKGGGGGGGGGGGNH